jgi:hypothetical protein
MNGHDRYADGYPMRPAGQVRAVPPKPSPSRAPGALLPGRRAQAVSARVSAARNARLAVRSPACAQRPPACRQLTAVLPYIRQYGVISARRCRPGQRRGCSRVRQAYPRRRDGGGQPDPNRQPGRRGPPPRSAGATMSPLGDCATGSLAAAGSSLPRRSARRPRRGCSQGPEPAGDARPASAAHSRGAVPPASMLGLRGRHAAGAGILPG